MRRDYAQVREEALRLAERNADRHQRLDAIWQFVHGLILIGWSRREVYALTSDLLRQSPLPDDWCDDFYELESALTGHCSPQSIIRFPDDPLDRDELAHNLRGMRWSA